MRKIYNKLREKNFCTWTELLKNIAADGWLAQQVEHVTPSWGCEFKPHMWCEVYLKLKKIHFLNTTANFIANNEI